MVQLVLLLLISAALTLLVVMPHLSPGQELVPCSLVSNVSVLIEPFWVRVFQVETRERLHYLYRCLGRAGLALFTEEKGGYRRNERGLPPK